MATNERWLVCGSRSISATNEKAVRERLEQLSFDRGRPQAIIHGGATGVDCVAQRWAWERGFEDVPFPAHWNTHGRAAGPIRNSRMLAEGKPTHVIAFPGGRGTADMVAKARRAGIPVIDGLTGEALK